jgi:hypothetical protein
MIPDFKIDENLKVEFLIPDETSNSFILGISLLGGSNVLGGLNEFIIDVSLLGGEDVLGPSTGLKWQEVTCSTARASISVGGTIEDSVFFQPAPATANLTLQTFELDPTVNKSIRAGTKIRIRVESVDVDRIVFQGYIDTIEVTYLPTGQNLIEITSFDAYKTLVNSRFRVWDTSPLGASATTDEIFELVAIQSGLGLSGFSKPLQGLIPTTNENNLLVSSVVNEALQVALALIWLDQDTEEIVVTPRPLNTATTYTPGEVVNTNRVIFSTTAANAANFSFLGLSSTTSWMTGMPYPSTYALRRTLNVAGSGATTRILMATVEPMPVVVPGETYTYSAYVNSQFSSNVSLSLTWTDASGTFFGQSTETSSTLPPNTTQRRQLTATAPAGATRVVGRLFYTSAGAVPGQHIDFSSPMIEQGSAAQIYFDGNTIDDPGPGFVYQWTGTPEQSSSVKRVLLPDPITGYWIIGNDHGSEDHLCMSQINVFSDADALYNSLNVELTSNPAIFVTRKNQDSIDFYGEAAIDLAINTTDATELNFWADRVFVQNPDNLVNQVVTPAKDRLGTLTEAAVFTPGMTVGVSYTNSQLDIVGYYTIIKVSHTIDPDNWFTTLELWKEA